MFIAIGAVILILFFLYFAVVDRRVEGFWVAGQSFLEQAEIDKMILYIGKRNWRGNAPAYMYIESEGAPIVNSEFVAKIRKRGLSTFSIDLNDLDIEGMPMKQTLELSAAGKLILRGGKEVFGILYKDHEASELGRK